MSDQTQSDRLAKNLSYFLYEIFDNDKQSKWLLRTHGLEDWIKYDHLDSNDPLELSAHVLVYLCNQNKIAELKILQGILGFLESRGYEIDPNQLRLIKPLLEASPIDEDGVLDWFKRSFRLP